MKPLKMMNKEEVDHFLNIARMNEHDCFSIKGKPPKGSTYSDGDLIERDINIGWRNAVTGETVDIKYE